MQSAHQVCIFNLQQLSIVKDTNNDFDPITHRTATITLGNAPISNIDAAIYEILSISGFVFTDINANGFIDAGIISYVKVTKSFASGESAFGGETLTLLDYATPPNILATTASDTTGGEKGSLSYF